MDVGYILFSYKLDNSVTPRSHQKLYMSVKRILKDMSILRIFLVSKA